MKDVLTNGTFWAGVVGVAGILGTFLAPIQMERRRERTERRRAVRLVVSELHQIQSAAEFVIHHRDVVHTEELAAQMFGVNEWKEHRGALAAHVPEDLWYQLTHTYQLLEGLDRAVVDEPLDDQEAETMSKIAEAARDARDRLGAL